MVVRRRGGGGEGGATTCLLRVYAISVFEIHPTPTGRPHPPLLFNTSTPHPHQVELIKFMESFGIAKLSGKAFVDGDLAVEVKEMTFGASVVLCAGLI